MNEITKKIKLIADRGIVPLLKQAGFRKNSTHFWKKDGEALQVINIQSSSWNNSAFGRFTLNIGVHFAEVAAMLPKNASMPDPPKEYCCLIRRRVGMLMPAGGDHWWKVAPETDADAVATELSGVLREYVFPWLEKLQTISAAADEMAPWPQAAARIILGDSERAAQLVQATIEHWKINRDPAFPANTDLAARWIDKMSQWAAKHKLKGFSET